MGKSSKKSKHINIGEDFRKQKLKAGKKKLSTNATITTFKSKSIYITEQLKTQAENEALSYSKQSLPELLSHLNHYSSNFRFRAMVGIKEIMAQKSTSLPTGISPGTILQKISKLIMDDDSEVRKTCISLLQLLFEELPEKKMSPHFPLLLSHLYCAMSHISVKVQKHSLKVVELLMKYFPNLIRFYAGPKLLQYFLELISVKESGLTSTGRILSTTFAFKKETAIQWRVRVLSQILSLLKILSQPTTAASKQGSERTYFCDTENLITQLLPTSSNMRGVTLESIQRKSVVASVGPSTRELLEITFPILLQCWMEVSASGVLEKDIETVQTMKNVLSITYLFCKDLNTESDNSMHENWLRKRYLTLFVKHFFNNFPFEPPETNQGVKDAKRRKTTIDTVKQSDYEHINLLVCNLCSLLTADRYMQEDSGRIETSVEYLADFLDTSLQAPSVNPQYIDLVISCLQRILSLQTAQAYGDEVLNNLYKYCCSSKCPRFNRSKIMQFMMEIYENYSSLRGYSCFERLLSDLPSYFVTALKDFAARPSDSCCKLRQRDSVAEFPISLLKCMQCGFRRKDIFFLNSVSKNLKIIVSMMVKNYENLFCSSHLDCIKCIQFQNSIFGCLLPQLPSMTESDFVSLSKFCCNSLIHMQCRTFVIDCLVLKVSPNDDLFCTPLNKTEAGYLLKFLFTALTVTTGKDAKVTNAVSQHLLLCNHICNAFKQMTEFWPDLWKVQNAFFEKKLKVASTSVGNETILGLLRLGCGLVKQNVVEIDFHGIGRFLAAFSMLCSKQSKDWEECVQSSIIELLRVSKIMHSYIRILIKSNSTLSIVSLIKFLEITELQESYKEFSSDITNYVAILEGNENSGDLRKLKSLSSALFAVL